MSQYAAAVLAPADPALAGGSMGPIPACACNMGAKAAAITLDSSLQQKCVINLPPPGGNQSLP